MMNVSVKKDVMSDGRENVTGYAISGSFSLAELLAMKERGEEAAYSIGLLMEIRRDGKVILERGNDMLDQFKDYLEKEMGDNFDYQGNYYASAQNCVSIFEQVRDKFDAESFEIVYEADSHRANDDPYKEAETSYIYKELRHKILVDGVKQLVVSGSDIGTAAKSVLRLADELGNIGYADSYNASECSEVIAFHPGYTYEEFMEKTLSLRGSKESVRTDELKQISRLVRIDGVFKEFCNFAAHNYKKMPYVLVIDNFESVDLTTVFGEAMTCLYPEYRGGAAKIRTMSQSYKWVNNTDNKLNHDNFSDGFYIPENVIIIGIDRGSRELSVPAGTFELVKQA